VHREDGLRRDCAVVAKCDEVWLVGGRISAGMLREATAARWAGRAVFDFTKLGDEPPATTTARRVPWSGGAR
jgi:hypothetical protein